MLAAAQTYSPAEVGTNAHCRRVAAWCERIAVSLHLASGDSAALQQAALAHHDSGPWRRHLGLSKLMGDLEIPPDRISVSGARSFSPQVEGILNDFRQKRAGGSLARILEAANLYDEHLECAPLEADSIHQVLASEPLSFCVKHLRKSSRAKLPGVFPKLPVYPVIAMRLHRMFREENISLGKLAEVARTDQVMAGKLVNAANSAFYSPLQPIKSVLQAISYVGTQDAKRLLLASAIQPLFTSVRMRQLWKHAIEAAEVAESIAVLSGKIDPAEAFLMGLLHDVGKLALSLMPEELNVCIDRLVRAGCAPALAELTVCGFDHAYAGAEVLRYWTFSEELVSAVQHHHQPERTSSKLGALLYLTEFWTDGEEDVPSNFRLNLALQRVGLSWESLQAASKRRQGVLGSL